MQPGIQTEKSGRWYIWVLLFPLLLFLILFILVPVAGTVLASFKRDITFLPIAWTGLANYRALFADPAFHQALRFTLLFILVSVPLETVLGLLLALLLNVNAPFRGMLRAMVLIPWALPAVVSGRIWELIYNVNYGLANWLLRFAGVETVNWLGSGRSAFWAIVVADVWKTVPFVAILLLAGLSAIPETLYRQAAVDGASFIRRFFWVTLPLLRPVLVVTLLFRTIDALRVFDLVFILTGGGPGGATTSLSYIGYRYFNGGDYGYGATLSVSTFLCALLLTLVIIKGGRFSGELS